MKYSIDDWLPYKDMMWQISADFKKRYPMVEVDDLQQEMYLWFISHPRKFKEWLELEEKDRIKLLAKSLRNQCLKYCEREKARKFGYDLSDIYYYDSSVVEAFMPSIISESYEMPAKIKDLANTVKTSEVNDGMNWLVLRSDIASAYYKLSEAKQEVLRIRFSREPADWPALAIEMKTTPDGARMKVNRAINSIVQLLGGNRYYYEPDIQETQAPDTTAEEGEADEAQG